MESTNINAALQKRLRRKNGGAGQARKVMRPADPNVLIHADD